MRVGICTSLAALPRGADGVDYVEGGVGDLLCPRADDAVFAERAEIARGAPVPITAVNGFIPGDLKTTGPHVDRRALDAFVATALRRANAVGVGIIVFGSGASRAVPEGWDADRAAEQLVDHMKRWGAMAADAAVTIVLEPLNRGECNIVNSVDEAARLVRRADHPNIRVLADTYHMAVEGDPPDAIRGAGELLAHVHCAEGEGRGPLGTVGEDHRPFFRALKDIGYQGGVSIEATWTDLHTQLRAAVAELKMQIETA